MTDRNLLFGILALQLDFVTRDQLIAAMNAWLVDKAKPLGDILRAHGALATDTHALLEALVRQHLAQHGEDAQRSLAALSSLPPSARDALAAVPDDDLRRTLQQVGIGHSEPTGTLPYPSTPTPTVGRYRILRPHARGGLGEVFVAEDTELGRSVALKEIQGSFADDAEARSRFVLEAEVTGGLEHPGIVPVYGLGTYADGRPFYAMRFIKGDSLKDAIQQFHAPQANPLQRAGFDSLAFRTLLGRFVDVCNAVAYAHSRGVLHRDLKPGNVMLGRYGETLLVDWGLAKVTGRAGNVSDRSGGMLRPRSACESSATQMGQALGTPAYMPPEQADGRLDLLGPGSDVYSLGATLYELLTGKAAFGGKTVTETLDDVRAGRFTAPRAARPGVPAALEAVCLKAMAREPSARYASALDLAQEIERWRADEPVLAYPEPLGTRAWRWVRRNRTPVTAAAVLLVASIVGLSAGLAAVDHERANTAKANGELILEQGRTRDALAAEKLRRRQTRDALEVMTSQMVEDDLAKKAFLTPDQRSFLEKALRSFQEFAADTGNDIEVRVGAASAYERVGLIRHRLDLPGAEDALRKAVDLRERLAADFPGDPNHRHALIVALDSLSRLLFDTGKHKEAEAVANVAIEKGTRLVTDHPPVAAYRHTLARGHANLGQMLDTFQRREPAAESYRRAVEVLEKLTSDHPNEPNYRGDLLANRERLAARLPTDQSITLYRTLIGDIDRLVEQNPRHVERRRLQAQANARLGFNLRFSREPKYDEAEVYYRRAIRQYGALAAEFPAVPVYSQLQAREMNDVAIMLGDLGKMDEQQALNLQTLAVRERLVADHPNVPEYRRDLGYSLNNLGATASAAGQIADAEAYYRRGLVVREQLATEFAAVPHYRRDLARAAKNIGSLLANDSARGAEARAHLRRAVDLFEQLTKEVEQLNNYIDAAETCIRLGSLADRSNEPAGAVEWYSRAIRALSAPFVARSPDPFVHRPLADAHRYRAEALARLGRPADIDADWLAAAREADVVAAAPNAPAPTLAACAAIYALASVSRPDAAATDRFGARAVELIRLALAKGFRDTAALVADADFDPLRRRPDFVDVLWELADGPTAK